MSEVKMTIADAFAYLLTFTMFADGDMDEKESAYAIDKLAELVNHFGLDADGDGDADFDDVKSAWKKAGTLYFDSDAEKRANYLMGCCAFLRKALGDDNMGAIASRIKSLAEADGVVTKHEEAVIAVTEGLLKG